MSIVSKSILSISFSIAFGLTATAQTLPLKAGSWGGKVRSGPGIDTAQIGSLKNGEIITVLENTEANMNGYPWFKIEYRNGQQGYKWGGILCGINEPVEGLFEVCTEAPASEATTSIPVSLKPNRHAQDIADCVSAENAAQRDGTACIGKVADPCLDDEDNFSTAGMRSCVNMEREIWDARLNANYQNLKNTLSDEAHKTALRDAQRHWIKFSNKFCGLEYEFYQGTMYLLTGDHCLLDMTARQSLQLKQLLPPDL